VETLSFKSTEFWEENEVERTILIDLLLPPKATDVELVSFQVLNYLKSYGDPQQLKWGGVILNLSQILSLGEFSQVYETSIEIFACINKLVNYAIDSGLQIGLAFNHCDELVPAIFEKDPALIGLLEGISYFVCYQTIDKNSFGKAELAKEFESFLYLKKVISQYHPNLQLVFRIFPALSLTESNLMGKYVRFLYHLKQLGLTYNICFFPVRAVNFHGVENSWWIISNYTDLTNVSVFEERESGKNFLYLNYHFK